MLASKANTISIFLLSMSRYELEEDILYELYRHEKEDDFKLSEEA